MKVNLNRSEKRMLVNSLGAQGVPQEIILGAFQKGVEFALTKKLPSDKVCSLLSKREIKATDDFISRIY